MVEQTYSNHTASFKLLSCQKRYPGTSSQRKLVCSVRPVEPVLWGLPAIQHSSFNLKQSRTNGTLCFSIFNSISILNILECEVFFKSTFSYATPNIQSSPSSWKINLWVNVSSANAQAVPPIWVWSRILLWTGKTTSISMKLPSFHSTGFWSQLRCHQHWPPFLPPHYCFWSPV